MEKWSIEKVGDEYHINKETWEAIVAMSEDYIKLLDINVNIVTHFGEQEDVEDVYGR